MLNKTTLLFLVIFIEGYVVLACELLAIRELIPFVGSGTETISMVISAVLLPLAVGYHWGGKAYQRQYAKARRHGQCTLSVRKLLLKNILSALGILTIGLSYIFLEIFFGLLNAVGIQHRLPQTAIYVSLFLIAPVFLLGQTVPLVSNYFSRRKLSEITGKMLFFSTTGSFLGSVFSTIVLMMTIGVHNTVIVTLGLLCALIFLLARRRDMYEMLFGLGIFAFLWLIHSDHTMQQLRIVSDNAYNTVSVVDVEKDNSILFNVNRSPSSKLNREGEVMYGYIKYIEHLLFPNGKATPVTRDILIIGAGGFTFGLNDTTNRYVFVDIDPHLKDVAEEHFLPKKLSPNKTFVAASAREFVRRDDQQYDVILVDAYTNVISVPMETTTREFLIDTKKLLKPDGLLIVNMISSPTFEDVFTVRYHNTFASVFPVYSRHVVNSYEVWPSRKTPPQFNNVLYMFFNTPRADDRGIYTDNKNTYSIDR